MAEFIGQCAADFFDDGHLLEGERALEVLAAVESASENEMAFQERAGVAEYLQDFVFGHRQECQVSGAKFQVFVRMACERRAATGGLKTRVRLFQLLSAGFRIPDSEF
jgi:hypothetical protein